MDATASDRLRDALAGASSSDRLQVALSAGTYPRPEYVEVLVERCASEPDFYVREMLTWALLRHPADLAVPLLIEQTRSSIVQARSQALHTLSKIRDGRGWAAITDRLLHDENEEVARTAWRAAVVLAPESERPALARTLTQQLGRGERDAQWSLSRSLADLGEAAWQALDDASRHADVHVRIHAIATSRMIDDPDEGFDSAIFEASRIVELGAE
jgi:HEAT repeat protein